MMTEHLPNRRRIDQINDLWKADCKFPIDLDGLIKAASDHLSIHQKYLDIKTVEQRQLARKKLQAEKFRFKLLRFYRDGTDDPETLQTAKERGWEIPPEGKPHMKTDVKLWVDTNDDMIELVLDLSEQNDIVEQINEILSAINNRSYAINKVIDAVIHRDGK
jgi:hypothetical protein